MSRDREDGRASPPCEQGEAGGPRAAQALAPCAGQSQGVGPEAYLNGTSQGELVLPVPSVVSGSLSKEHPRTPGRTSISVVAASDS